MCWLRSFAHHFLAVLSLFWVWWREFVLNSHLIFFTKYVPKLREKAGQLAVHIRLVLSAILTYFRYKSETFVRSPKAIICALFSLIFIGLISAFTLKDESVNPPRAITINMENWAKEKTKKEVRLIQIEEDVEALDINLPSYEYKIQLGDNLTYLFRKLAIPYQDLLDILEADSDELKFDALKIGNLLRFWLDENNQRLSKLEIEFNLLSKVQYIRDESGKFKFEHLELKGQHRRAVIVGEIRDDFAKAATRAGLTDKEIEQIKALFRYQFNFHKELKKGDKFSVVRTEQFLDDEPTGISQIQAATIKQDTGEVSAYLHQDGTYYDKLGNTLSQTFLRYPTKEKPRITSSFNHRRIHPVTGKIVAHLGTDFSAKTGSNVLATSDGVVSLVRNHPLAGKYLVIDHGNQYQTRYMHNSKILVRKGDKVKKGQVIALSGSTGRVTGPHIHYELLVKGRAVDPMKAYLPEGKRVPLKDAYLFKRRVMEFDRLMDVAELQIVAN